MKAKSSDLIFSSFLPWKKGRRCLVGFCYCGKGWTCVCCCWTALDVDVSGYGRASWCCRADSQCEEPAVSLTVCGRRCLGRDMVGGLETGHLPSVWDRINRKRVNESERSWGPLGLSRAPLHSLCCFYIPLKVQTRFQAGFIPLTLLLRLCKCKSSKLK